MRLLLFVCGLSTMLPSPWAAGPPQLEDYPATDIFRGTPARLVLATKDARMFRTELRRQAARGPNFAGHYTLALWGVRRGVCKRRSDGRALWSGVVRPFTWSDAWEVSQPNSGSWQIVLSSLEDYGGRR
jgi:hypothetical protein